MKQAFMMVDGYANLLDDYIFDFCANEDAILAGKHSAFDNTYLPILRKQGVGLIYLSIGGEHTAQVMYGATDKFKFWDAHKNLDMFLAEEEQGLGNFVLVRKAADIDKAIAEDKIAILATLSGGKPLEGKPNYQCLANLRSLYRAGLRAVQLTGNGRNRLADGCGQHITEGRLTNYGVQVVKEAERLGMIIDTAQLNDAGFFDLAEITALPLLDSHTCARELSDHPQNIDLKRIEAIAKSGGVIALNLRAPLLAMAKDAALIEDLLKQLDYLIKYAGIDHIAIGPDYAGYKTPVDRSKYQGLSNVGFIESDYQTPYQSERYPGYMEAVWYGIRKDDFVEKVGCRENYSLLPQILKEHGLSDKDCAAIMGENLLKLYRKVLA